MTKLDAIESGIVRQARDAQSGAPRASDSFAEFDARLRSMTARVDAGVADNSLTAAEAADVRGNLDRLRAKLAQYRSDSTLSASERQDLNTQFEVVSGGLAKQRNDAQAR